jgi:hypothetical protein
MKPARRYGGESMKPSSLLELTVPSRSRTPETIYLRSVLVGGDGFEPPTPAS